MLASSSNRAILADQTNNPYTRFVETSGKNLQMHTFNFFTDSNQNGDISREFWITKRLQFSSRYELDVLLAGEEFDSIAGVEDFVMEIKTLSRELERLNPQVFGVLLPNYRNEEVNWNSVALIVSVGASSTKISKATVKDLALRIHHNTNRDSLLGKKGLKFSTSAIELFLSTTKSIYPGDCDALIIQDSKPKVIVEFKKHTLRDPISEWTIDKFFNTSDRYKYLSLQALSRNLSHFSGNNIPIVVFYFATKFQGARIDVLSNQSMEITSTSGDLVATDVDSVSNSLRDFVNYLTPLIR